MDCTNRTSRTLVVGLGSLGRRLCMCLIVSSTSVENSIGKGVVDLSVLKIT